MADDGLRLRITGTAPLAPAVTRARQYSIELFANHLLNELADSLANAGFDRIKPIVQKCGRSCSGRLRSYRLRGNACHGVVSSPARQRRVIRG
jgi:hypothetical protein